jgi:hypothetical protein
MEHAIFIRPRPARSERIKPAHILEAAAWENAAMQGTIGGEDKSAKGDPEKVLSRMEPGREYTAADVARRCGYDTRTAAYHLSRLADCGRISRQIIKADKGRLRVWVKP